MAIKISGNTVIDDSRNITSSGTMSANAYIGDGSQLTNLPGGGNVLEATASGTLADGDPVVVNTNGTVSVVARVGSAWIATLGGATFDAGKDIAVDSSGNVFVVGEADIGGQYDLIIAKYNSSGTIQWQRALASDSGPGVAVDSGGNVYVVGRTYLGSSSSNDVTIAKYNSSGTIQWQRKLGGTGSDNGYDITVDSSDNVYISGHTNSAGAGSDDILIAKYNSSGTIQWQRTLGDSSANYVEAIAVDGSGNVYVTGSTSYGAYYMYVTKLNSSGTIQWTRRIGSGNGEGGNGIAIDSSGNVYVTGRTRRSGYTDHEVWIVKYNSSGNIQYQRTLGGTNTDRGNGIVIDSSDNVYVVGATNSAGSGGFDFIIVKYNSSGTVQWQRTLGVSSNDQGVEIAVDNSGHIYVIGYSDDGTGNNDFLIAKLPDDGTLTGTYGSITYAASSFTDAESFLTNQSHSFTSSTSNLPESASSLNDSASSLTSSTISMAPTNLTSENFIGISDGAYSNGQTATIQLAGSVDDAQSGLTPGSKYYVQNNGTLSTTADSPSVFAGTAAATTKLIVKN